MLLLSVGMYFLSTIIAGPSGFVKTGYFLAPQANTSPKSHNKYATVFEREWPETGESSYSSRWCRSTAAQIMSG
jgi:hypothetical protein